MTVSPTARQRDHSVAAEDFPLLFGRSNSRKRWAIIPLPPATTATPSLATAICHGAGTAVEGSRERTRGRFGEAVRMVHRAAAVTTTLKRACPPVPVCPSTRQPIPWGAFPTLVPRSPQ